ncbi:MAG: ECF-type sigma factor [Xanthomonadales bacterium]|jgi:RNA polymerase sigma factor (TIGR02999 family)|nr:ECF-type sigma factor [Xanthomonadales bacterium]
MNPDSPKGSLTGSLRRWMAGDHSAEAELLDTVYPWLRAVAQRQLRSGGRITLQATELAHEAFLRLREESRIAVEDRQHFLSFAARVMRNLVIDHIRERSTSKRGGDVVIIGLHQADDLPQGGLDRMADWLAIDHALRDLEQESREHAQLAEMRYFLGMTIEQCAEELGITAAMVQLRWRFARAFLATRLSGSRRSTSPPS